MRGISRLTANTVSFSRRTLLHGVSKLIITVVGFSRKLLSPFYYDTDKESTEPQNVS